MKRLLIIAALVIGCYSAKAQPGIYNLTGCEVMVTVHCYQESPCTWTSTPVLLGGPAIAVPFPSSCSGLNPATDYVLFQVCWYNYPGAPCENNYSPQCTLIDGFFTGVTSSACGWPASPGTYTGTIAACPNCTTVWGNGVAQVTYNPITNILEIK